jgi:hypothetical protein
LRAGFVPLQDRLTSASPQICALWQREELCVWRLQKKTEAAEYHKLLVQRLKEQRERRSESLAKKRAMRQASQASAEA